MKGEANVVMLRVNDILPNRFQPRIKFSEDKIGELAESIRKYGVIQPIIVRRVGDKYEIIAGERRYKASVLAGLSEMPAIINNLNDKDSSEIALIENVQRENLTPIEEAISYKKILDMGYLTQDNLASKLGISQSAVANKLRLLNLTEDVQEALLENKISERHARSLLKLKNEDEQEKMLHRIITERLTVRKLDGEIQKIISQNSEEEDENPNEEIEILNILNSYNEEKNIKEKEEEEHMNPSDPMNQFNIPEVNIINNNPGETVVNQNPAPTGFSPIPDANIGVNSVPNPTMEPLQDPTPLSQTMNANNPGFMDIDRIQREAVDIPQMNPAPGAMPSLLQPETKEELVANSQVGQVETQGKFFDVMPSMQNHQDAAVGMKVDSAPMSGTPSAAPVGDLDTNFTNILEHPVIEPVPVPVSPQVTGVTDQVDSTSTTESSGVFTQNPLKETLQNQSIPAETNENLASGVSIEPVISPTVEPAVEALSSPLPTFDFNEQPQMPNVDIPVPNTPTSVIDEPAIMEPISTPTIEENIVNPIESSVSVVEPVIEPIAINPLPSEQPVSPTVEPIIPMENIDSTPEVASETINPSVVIEKPVVGINIKMALDVITRATEEIQKLGFPVILEEMDLGNTYQVTIKINK